MDGHENRATSLATLTVRSENVAHEARADRLRYPGRCPRVP